MSNQDQRDGMEEKGGVTPSLDHFFKDQPKFEEEFEHSLDVLEGAALIREMRELAINDAGGRGIKQRELAERLGVNPARISELERGTGRDGVSYALLKRIARACRVDWPLPLTDPIEQPDIVEAPEFESSRPQPASSQPSVPTEELMEVFIKRVSLLLRQRRTTGSLARGQLILGLLPESESMVRKLSEAIHHDYPGHKTVVIVDPDEPSESRVIKVD